MCFKEPVYCQKVPKDTPCDFLEFKGRKATGLKGTGIFIYDQDGDEIQEIDLKQKITDVFKSEDENGKEFSINLTEKTAASKFFPSKSIHFRSASNKKLKVKVTYPTKDYETQRTIGGCVMY